MSMNIPLLFPPDTIPKGPKSALANSTLIRKWEMWINDSGEPEPGRWAGFSVPMAKKAVSGYLDGTETPFDIFAGYCRLLDESGILITAHSKTALVRQIAELCEKGTAE